MDAQLTAMDKVRIVRHPQRASLKDILENVYDNYTEIGGQDEHSIDPGMLIARAYITRRRGKKIINQPGVMVVGQRKGPRRRIPQRRFHQALGKQQGAEIHEGCCP